MAKLIYIAGYGRSGSTLLELALGNHKKLVSMGEVAKCFDELTEPQSQCSCGQRLNQCSTWEAITGTLQPKTKEIGNWHELHRITKSHERLFGKPNNMPAYQEIWHSFFDAYAEATSAEILIDSSKSTHASQNRLTNIAKEHDVAVVHLIRNPQAVLWSCFRGHTNRLPFEKGRRAKPGTGLVRATIGWVATNLVVERQLAKLKSVKSVRIRYEDFVTSPESELSKILALVDLEVDDSLTRALTNDEIDVGHAISGNRSRRNPTLKLKLDDEWKTQLPFAGKVCSRLMYPMLKKYGYA